MSNESIKTRIEGDILIAAELMDRSWEIETVKTLYPSGDQVEGAHAFAEKRDPVWIGR